MIVKCDCNESSELGQSAEYLFSTRLLGLPVVMCNYCRRIIGASSVANYIYGKMPLDAKFEPETVTRYNKREVLVYVQKM